MKHYSIGGWADYVRGLVSDSRREAMRRHLESGCRRCAGQVRALERVLMSAAFEAEHLPAERAVRAAKALFQLDRPERRALLPSLALDLAFDSALSPRPAGTRGAEEGGRMLRFESAGYALDLQVTREPEGRRTVLVGDCRRGLGVPMGRIPVFLISGGRLAASALTGRRGELHLEAELGAEVELWLLPEEGKRIAARLPADPEED